MTHDYTSGTCYCEQDFDYNTKTTFPITCRLFLSHLSKVKVRDIKLDIVGFLLYSAFLIKCLLQRETIILYCGIQNLQPQMNLLLHLSQTVTVYDLIHAGICN